MARSRTAATRTASPARASAIELPAREAMNEGAHFERRRTDRRRGDRRVDERTTRPRPAEESLFGALGAEGDTGFHPDDIGDARATVASAGRDSRHDEQRRRTREARRVAGSNDTALRRVYSTYVAARAVLGLLLALVPWVVTLP